MPDIKWGLVGESRLRTGDLKFRRVRCKGVLQGCAVLVRVARESVVRVVRPFGGMISPARKHAAAPTACSLRHPTPSEAKLGGANKMMWA